MMNGILEVSQNTSAGNKIFIEKNQNPLGSIKNRKLQIAFFLVDNKQSGVNVLSSL